MQNRIGGGNLAYEASEVTLEEDGLDESSNSAVSWGAIVAGAFAAAALSLILLAFGAGFGLSSVSPWPRAGAAASTIGAMAIVWLVVTQWLSAGIGGYMAGRLRTKWTGVHSDEVYFRDTAHGFLAWAVGAVISAAVLSSAVSSLVGETAQVGATAASGIAQGASQMTSQAAGGAGESSGYFVDTLFRSDKPSADANPAAVRDEVTRILAMGARSGDVAAPDKAYLAQLVAARTGLSQPDAEKRVNDVLTQAKNAATEAANKAREAADEARKGASYLAFASCISMLIGAFIAGVAGALGGKRRDINEGSEMAV